MIRFSSFIKEERQYKSVTTLDDIESGVFNGKDGIEKSISLVEMYLEKNKNKIPEEKYTKIKSLCYRTKDLYSSIPLGILNRVAINDTIKGYIKSYDDKHIRVGSKIANPTQHVIELNSEVIQKINQEIIHSVRQDTRLNREKEKNELVKFFRTNSGTLIKMYELYNLFLDVKDAINE